MPVALFSARNVNRAVAMAAFCALLPWPAWAASGPDSGDTAWMIVATALVLLMTLPGLALFYGGLVRTKNVLSVLVQCFSLAGVITILWVAFGYSLAFRGGGDLVGNFEAAFLAGIGRDTLAGTIPESIFVLFQLTFAIITPALIVGAFAERMKFAAAMIFTSLWFVLSYLPIAHMAWGGGLFHHWGVIDFAGGTVVHVNAGIAGLVAALMLGKRKGYPRTPMKPHNMTMCLTGAALLWVGWFGFNAGSQLAADGVAGMAMLVTHIATATAVVVWSAIEWIRHGKPSALGAASGAVAGLVAITPASGTVGPLGALCIGALSGGLCYITAVPIKQRFGYDDSLDVFGIHGVGGIVGCVLTGVFSAQTLGGFAGEGWPGIGHQTAMQTASLLVTIVWSAVVSVVVLAAVKAVIGLRVDEETEEQGLDVMQHGEAGYIF